MVEGLKPYPEYQDSGSPLVGQVPRHWEVHSLRTLIRGRNARNRVDLPLLSVVRERGVILRSSMRQEENHNFIPDDLSNYKVVRKGDLVINKMKAWQGSMGVAPCDGIVSPAYYVFEFRMENGAYGQALFRSRPYVGEFGRASDGVRVGQWDLSIPGMKKIPVLTPPRDEQDAIVHFLDHANHRLEKAIRAKQKVIKLLNEQKQVIIHRAVTRGLDPNVRLKPSRMKWLGDIPEHWEIVSLAAASKLIQTGPFGSQLHSHEYVTGGTPVINPSHMRGGQVVPDMSVAIGSDKVAELTRHTIQAGDIIAARRGDLGRCAEVSGTSEGWICGTGSLLIRPKTEVLFPGYLQRVFSSKGVAECLTLSSIGATMANLNAGMVGRLRVPVPPIHEQIQLVTTIKRQEEGHKRVIEKLLAEVTLLQEYRTRLIADVVTGKLDVRTAAARLPDEEEPAEWEEVEGLAEDQTEEEVVDD